MNGRMRELEERINEIRSNLNTNVPQNPIHSINDIIREGTLSTVGELLSQQVEGLSQVICIKLLVKNEMRCLNYKRELILRI